MFTYLDLFYKAEVPIHNFTLVNEVSMVQNLKRFDMGLKPESSCKGSLNYKTLQN